MLKHNGLGETSKSNGQEPSLDIDLRQGFRLGDWKVYPNQGVIEASSGELHLEPKVMDVLVYLAERSHDVVSRDDLINDVWQGTFVTDEVLSRAISLLRSSLGDDSKAPSYIQTLPKLGYRLLMPVAAMEEPAGEPKSDTENGSVYWRYLVSGVILAVFVFVVLFLPSSKVSLDRQAPEAYNDISNWFDSLIDDEVGDSKISSIAVLPFTSLSEDRESKYFSDGLTDEITTSLSKIKGLKVVARRSSYSFKGSKEDIPTVGRLLKVDAVLEGSVRRKEDRLRIAVQLSSVEDGYLLWSEAYDRNISDVFNIQENISTALVDAISAHLSTNGIEALPISQTTPELEAYKIYLMNGNFLWKLRGETPLRESANLYRKALSIDPKFSRAAIGLASSLVLLPFYSSEPMAEMFQSALDVLDGQEFSSDRERGEAEAVRAFIAQYRWRWVEAEERFRKALKLAPQSASIYAWYSQHLAYVGRKEDSLKTILRAQELDAVSPVINDRLGVAHLWLNNNEMAAKQFAYGAQLGFRNGINPAYIIFVLRQKRFNEFKSLMEALHRGTDLTPEWLLHHDGELFLPENKEKTLAIAVQASDKGEFILPMFKFGMWITLGGMDQAYEVFDQFKDGRHEYLHLEYIFAEEGREFREHPRFKKLAKEIGWQEYWDTYGGPDQ